MKEKRLVGVAMVTRPIGLKGGVRVEMILGSPDRLDAHPEVWVARGAAPPVAKRVVSISVRPNGTVVQLEGVTSREDAETLRGCTIFLSETAARELNEGKARVDELVGCSVVGPAGEELGTLREVYEGPAHRIWSVWTGTKEVLVPAVDAWVSGVDTGKRRITLRSAELFEIV